METFFGKVCNHEMILNNMGQIANNLWKLIPDHFNCVILGPFVIMPNHLHGIISINKSDSSNTVSNLGSTRFRNQGKNSLSSIIGSYKSAVSKSVHKITSMFSWQPRFYDTIIDNSDTYLRIKKYIEDNPANWEKDKYHKDHHLN